MCVDFKLGKKNHVYNCLIQKNLKEKATCGNRLGRPTVPYNLAYDRPG